MKSNLAKLIFIIAITLFTANTSAQKFSGKITYISKAKMDLGSWGARLSEARKKQVAARLKNRLEKTSVLVTSIGRQGRSIGSLWI